MVHEAKWLLDLIVSLMCNIEGWSQFVSSFLRKYNIPVIQSWITQWVEKGGDTAIEFFVVLESFSHWRISSHEIDLP